MHLFTIHHQPPIFNVVIHFVFATFNTRWPCTAFPVASARAWNSLPSSVRNAPSLTTFRRELKTVLCTVPLQCLWRDSVTLISTLLLTYSPIFSAQQVTDCIVICRPSTESSISAQHRPVSRLSSVSVKPTTSTACIRHVSYINTRP